MQKRHNFLFSTKKVTVLILLNEPGKNTSYYPTYMFMVRIFWKICIFSKYQLNFIILFSYQVEKYTFITWFFSRQQIAEKTWKVRVI